MITVKARKITWCNNELLLAGKEFGPIGTKEIIENFREAMAFLTPTGQIISNCEVIGSRDEITFSDEYVTLEITSEAENNLKTLEAKAIRNLTETFQSMMIKLIEEMNEFFGGGFEINCVSIKKPSKAFYDKFISFPDKERAVSFTMGYDSAKNGKNELNSRSDYFDTIEKLGAWSEGRELGERELSEEKNKQE